MTLGETDSHRPEVDQSSPVAYAGQLELAKWLAIITMTIDHYGKIVDTSLYDETNAIGRLTYPLFAWIIGMRLSSNPGLVSRYLWNIALWALISQPVYVFAGKQWADLNIFFTLALGVMAFHALRQYLVGDRLRGMLLAAAALLLAIFVDYGPFGVFMVPAIAWLASRNVTRAAWSAGPLGALANTMPQAPFLGPGGLFALATSVVTVASLRIRITLPRLPKQLFYAYYPGHLLVLAVIARL